MVRVLGTSCTAITGADAVFVSPTVVATSASVVTDAVAIAVHSDGGVVRGRVKSVDATHHVALVELLPTGDGSRLTGTPVALGTAADRSKVSVVGHPVGQALHRAPGEVQGSGEAVTTTAVAAPSVGGSPVVSGDGKLVGIVTDSSATQSSVAAASTITALLKGSADAPATPKCTPGGPSMTSIHPDAPGVRQALGRWTDAVNAKDAAALQTVMGPSLLKTYGRNPAEAGKKYLTSLKGATVDAANVDNLEMRDGTRDTLVWTVQLSGPGKACVVRKQQLVLTSVTNQWTVDEVRELGTSACS